MLENSHTTEHGAISSVGRASRLHRDTADQIAAVPSINDGSERELMANSSEQRDHFLPKRRRRENDIKAPDGYLLGGLRKVRKDGTVLFQRGWWQCPMEWAGEAVWLHMWSDLWGRNEAVEAWPPGVHIWTHKAETEILERTERRDAKPGYRRADHKAWHARTTGSAV